MGHFRDACRVLDTPGLLNRDKRNDIELLTLAILEHTPSNIIYVVDPTGLSMDVMDQLEIREEIRSTYAPRIWIDVLTKEDVAIVEDDELMAERLDDVRQRIPDALMTSSATAYNIEELQRRIVTALE